MNNGAEKIDSQQVERIERIIDNWRHWPFNLNTRPVKESCSPVKTSKDEVSLNQTVCLRSDHFRLALRFPVRELESKLSLQLEFTIQGLLAEQGIAPLAHLEENCLITEWIEAEVIETIQSKQLENLLRLVRQVHSTDISNLNLPPYSYLEVLRFYIEQADEDLASSKVQGALHKLAQYETQFGHKRCLTHNDLNTGNVLWQGTASAQSRCWLIDWEFAGSGIASFDLASIAVEYKLDKNQVHTAAIAAGLDVGKDELELAIDCYQLICHFYRLALSSIA